ncbi:conjugative transposon protein TraJ [Pedobacter sp. SYP-B3415]|uniref:conjugative transposon protein TraJ n=1 Tax=Pedobacter sp. SYP-B3415 TaxID=2496641 RepID=UPI00101BE147|nr:conjugative transposon protein TraJ [Pedobacter sp. SYP-B3415]
MKTKFNLCTTLAISALLLAPRQVQAREISDTIRGMQPVLDEVYNQMLPLSSRLTGVARGLAGFGALWYIASRVWRQIASAEPIDVYPLLRPFALGLCVLAFPAVIAVLNGVLQPTVSATNAMVEDSQVAIERLLKAKQEAVKKSKYYQMYEGIDGQGDSDKWYRYKFPADPDRKKENLLENWGHEMQFWMEKQSYAFRNSIKNWLSQVLEVLYAAASLCINTLRTFFLIVLAILGPLVFGFAVFDGFQQTLTVWLARYINIFLWLPVANIFGSILGKIQENMLKIDLSQIDSHGDTFFSATDTGYLVFLIIGIVGYFSVPNVANYIVHAGGGNVMLQKINSLSSSTATSGAAALASGVGMAGDILGDSVRRANHGHVGDSSGDYFPDNQRQKNKISGDA